MTNFNQIRCPKQGCYGWVNFIDDFYDCGQCGNVWFSSDELKSDIEWIVQKYEYRKIVILWIMFWWHWTMSQKIIQNW